MWDMRISKYGGRVSVISFHQGNGWQYVGSPGFSDNAPWSNGCEGMPAIAFDHDQTLYAIFEDGGSWNFSVMKYANGAWQYVGKPKFARGWLSGSTTHIAFDSRNTPYIVSSSFVDKPPFVMKYYKNNWVSVGSFNTGTAGGASIAIDKNDVPYVAYVDKSGKHRVVVQKYTADKGWISLGENDLTEIVNDFNNIDIAIDKEQIPYIAYSVLDNHNKIGMVKKFVFGRWVTLGSLPISMYGIRIALDSKNYPFISFQDGYKESKASVMHLENEGWVFVGPREFSDGKWAPNGLSIALDGNDVPYVAYGIDNWPTHGTTVMKFEETKSIK